MSSAIPAPDALRRDLPAALARAARPAGLVLLSLLAIALLLSLLLDVLPAGWSDGPGRLFALLTGDFGVSSSLGQPVVALVADRLAVTLPIALGGLLLATGPGLWLATIIRREPTARLSRGVAAAARLVGGTPGFFIGMLLALLVIGQWRLLPTGGFVPWQVDPLGAARSLLLPAIAIALPQAALIALDLRETPTGGLRDIRFGRHWAMLVAAALVTETVFFLPGLGRLALSAATASDLPLLRGTLFVVAIVIAVGALTARLLRDEFRRRAA